MFYLLDKPKGISSFKAIKTFASEHNIKKVGHTGTLDPLATGLLLIATDADTKLIDYVDKGFKSYLATMELGKTSNTYDVEGEVIQNNIDTLPSKEDIVVAFKKFEGKSMQTRPAFSAKKINGQRSYDLARKGEEIKLKNSEVFMKDFEITSINNETISFHVTVSRGTYIRSLINDIGKILSTGAIMTELRRTSIGNLNEDDLGKEVSIKKLLTLPIVAQENIDNLKDGKIIDVDFEDKKYALEFKNEIVGIVEVKNNKMRVIKLLGNKL